MPLARVIRGANEKYGLKIFQIISSFAWPIDNSCFVKSQPI